MVDAPLLHQPPTTTAEADLIQEQLVPGEVVRGPITYWSMPARAPFYPMVGPRTVGVVPPPQFAPELTAVAISSNALHWIELAASAKSVTVAAHTRISLADIGGVQISLTKRKNFGRHLFSTPVTEQVVLMTVWWQGNEAVLESRFAEAKITGRELQQALADFAPAREASSQTESGLLAFRPATWTTCTNCGAPGQKGRCKYCLVDIDPTG